MNTGITNAAFDINNVDVDKLLFLASVDMISDSHFIHPIADFYQQNKVELYKMANEHPLYNSAAFDEYLLVDEIAARRIFAVLLLAKEEESARKLILNLCKTHEHNRTLIKYIDTKNVLNIERILTNPNRIREGSQANLSMSVCFCYLFYTYGLPTEDKFANQVYAFIANVLIPRTAYVENRYKDYFDNINVHDKGIVVRENRKAFDYISSGRQILELLEVSQFTSHLKQFAQMGILGGFDVIAPEYRAFFEKKDNNLIRDIERTCRFIQSLCGVMNYNSLSLTAAIENVQLTPEEKRAIPKIIVATKEQDDKIEFYDYVSVSVFYMFAKIFKETRNFYMANNSEADFFELQKYINENEQLKKTIEIIEDERNATREENAKLNDIISDLKAANNEADRGLVKPYQDEIEMLRAKVASLESTLDEKEKEAQELYRLRELAFDLKQTDYIPESKKPLTELITGKKLVLVGGHINLRNKLTEKYPDMTILDGHNASVPEAVFANADLVIFNTANMSHTVYYRVLNIIRANGIKFDYLGRVSNPDLIEQELARIVEKYN